MATFKVVGIGQNGKYMDDTSRSDVIAYCFQPHKIPHSLIGGMGVNPLYAAEEMVTLANSYNKDSGLRLRHWVISFSPKEKVSLQMANAIGRQAIRFYGQTYQIIYAVHEDKNHPHIHVVMNSVSFLDGRKYHGEKKDYYRYLAYLKEVLFAYGLVLVA